MAETIAAGGRGTPCTMRLFDATSMAPIWIGLLISASFMAGLGLLALAFGWTWVAAMLPVDVLVSLVVGFLPVVTAYGLRGAVRDLHDLRPALDLRDADFAQWVDGIAAERAVPNVFPRSLLREFPDRSERAGDLRADGNRCRGIRAREPRSPDIGRSATYTRQKA